MSRVIIDRENLRVRKNSSSGACLAPHFNGFSGRGWCRSFPGFQTPANQHHSLLVMLLMGSSTRRLARCPSSALMPRASSFRASPALFGECVGCRLYALRSALIEQRIRTLKASELNRLERLKKRPKSVLMALLMVTLLVCLCLIPKVTTWIV